MNARNPIEGHAHLRDRPSTDEQKNSTQVRQEGEALERTLDDKILRRVERPPPAPTRASPQVLVLGFTLLGSTASSPHPEQSQGEHRDKIPVGIPRITRPSIRHGGQRWPEGPK